MVESGKLTNERIDYNEPKLAKPGAGLPFFEWAIANYILVPRLLKNTSRESALAAFKLESNKILALARSLSSSDFAQRRLIPRLRGLEDSSRFWSVAMTLHHLIIAGNGTRQIIVDLAHGGTTIPPVSTADIKPDPNVDITKVLQTFEEMSQRFLQDTTALNVDAFPMATYPHPWFGPLNASQWLKFAAPHANIHRNQIKEIISRL